VVTVDQEAVLGDPGEAQVRAQLLWRPAARGKRAAQQAEHESHEKGAGDRLWGP
jgi:hypothetical protein